MSILGTAYTAAIYGHGKIDVGPVYIHTDVLESGQVKDKLDTYGMRADGTLQAFPCSPWLQGVFVKPTVTYAEGDGKYFSTGCGLAHYIPITCKFKLAPSVGVNYTTVRSNTDFPAFGLYDLKQRFRAWTPYVGLEGYYTFNDQWMLSGGIQYGWAKTRTEYETLGTFKGESKGLSYSAMVDYYFTKCWSVNLAVAYNHQRTQERHGNKSLGGRLGLGYTY